MQNIAYQNKDIAQKYSAELLKDKSLAAIIFTRIVWQYSGSFCFEERRCGHYKSIFRDCSVGAGSSDVSAGISA